jgi:hypothetical protein
MTDWVKLYGKYDTTFYDSQESHSKGVTEGGV